MRLSQSFFSRTMAGVACAALSCAAFAQQDYHGRKYVPPAPVTRLSVHVTKESNGKPVANAAVVFHPLKNGRDDGNMELKTDQEGVAELDLLPQKSTVLVQVVAPGFQTYGQTFSIDGEAQKIDVVMKRPTTQYTAYGANSSNDHDKAGNPDLKLTPLPATPVAGANGTSAPQTLKDSGAASPSAAPPAATPAASSAPVAGDSPSEKH